MSIFCPKCNHEFKGHTNFYGKICTRCGFEIEPDTEVSVIKENRSKLKQVLKQARESVRRKFRRYNGNTNEQS